MRAVSVLVYYYYNGLSPSRIEAPWGVTYCGSLTPTPLEQLPQGVNHHPSYLLRERVGELRVKKGENAEVSGLLRSYDLLEEILRGDSISYKAAVGKLNTKFGYCTGNLECDISSFFGFFCTVHT